MILQPMQASSDLRKYLYKNGFDIKEEMLVKEDFRIYEIMVVRYTGLETSLKDEIYYEIGKGLLKNNNCLILEFIDKKIRECWKIIKKIEGKEGEKIESKIYECRVKIQRLEELKNNVC